MTEDIKKKKELLVKDQETTIIIQPTDVQPEQLESEELRNFIHETVNEEPSLIINTSNEFHTEEPIDTTNTEYQSNQSKILEASSIAEDQPETKLQDQRDSSDTLLTESTPDDFEQGKDLEELIAVLLIAFFEASTSSY